MVSVKLLKPYCIKTDLENIYVYLDEEHFTISIQNEVYQFIPEQSKQFIINRRTKKIENLDATFAFKKDDNVFYLTMSELINIPDFLIKLYFITKPHIEYVQTENINEDIDVIMDQLVQQNIKRLIDKALDERNEEAFYDLIALL
ncbi:IDEAL domain-containing protein [Ornithinibacillus sp. BX22]|uniref:IDEAL domain-containing protein n=2 Tax=Ornithinibacillus TaxID=484508 RepID=A0A923L7E8_9BACI|nr:MULTISPECIES: IDEAL domain-containing protein [Ornithinibacillus]MBC5637923.1 IDEAL domain-containing protein [Ornithinibacillus hominis]MBS3681713.1 IDEAL domain-containing protein [Ornithinibacillus massiliensis]